MIAKPQPQPQPLFKTLNTLKKEILELELRNERLKKDAKFIYKRWQEEERKRKELESMSIEEILELAYLWKQSKIKINS